MKYLAALFFLVVLCSPAWAVDIDLATLRFYLPLGILSAFILPRILDIR